MGILELTINKDEAQKNYTGNDEVKAHTSHSYIMIGNRLVKWTTKVRNSKDRKGMFISNGPELKPGYH